MLPTRVDLNTTEEKDEQIKIADISQTTERHRGLTNGVSKNIWNINLPSNLNLGSLESNENVQSENTIDGAQASACGENAQFLEKYGVQPNVIKLPKSTSLR